MDVFNRAKIFVLSFRFQKDTCEGKGKTLNLNKSTDTGFFFSKHTCTTLSENA